MISTKKLGKINSLQLVRGIAALLVAGYHGSLLFDRLLSKDFLFNSLTFGTFGVDIFFVLSGFIILYVHYGDIGYSERVRQFLVKRFVRVYPVYWIVLSVKLTLSIFSKYSDTHEQGWIPTLKAYLLFPQDKEIVDRFLGVSWTLSYEIFFYLVFCLLIFLKPKFCIPLFAIWTAGIALNLFGIVRIDDSQIILDFIFNQLNLEFFLGCLIAYLAITNWLSGKKYLFYIGLFLYSIAVINFYYEFLPNLPRAVEWGTPAVFVISGLVAMELTKPIAISQFFTFLGDASFSIYLTHFFVMTNYAKVVAMSGIGKLAAQNPIGIAAIAILSLVAAVAVGGIVHYLIERPVIEVLRKKLL